MNRVINQIKEWVLRKHIFGFLAAASIATNALADLSLGNNTANEWVKNPYAISHTATGVQTSVAAKFVTTGPNYYQQTGWKYKTQGLPFVQNMNAPLPTNAFVTTTLTDGVTISTRQYFIATPYSVPSSVASSAASSTYGTFPAGYCTNYASRAFHVGPNIAQSYTPWSGNAKDWITRSDAAGWRTSSSTTGGLIGAVVVWGGPKFGHVAIVTDMNKNSNGTISYSIQEMNYGSTWVNVDLAITDKFGIVTSATLNSASMSRGTSLPFLGFVLPFRK